VRHSGTAAQHMAMAWLPPCACRRTMPVIEIQAPIWQSSRAAVSAGSRSPPAARDRAGGAPAARCCRCTRCPSIEHQVSTA